MGLIVAAFAATIALHSIVGARAGEARRIVVEIHKFRFVPQVAKLNIGDVVVWKNKDIVPHTATSKMRGWDSGTIKAGGEWEVLVTQDMRGTYICRFHPLMVANIEIGIE